MSNIFDYYIAEHLFVFVHIGNTHTKTPHISTGRLEKNVFGGDQRPTQIMPAAENQNTGNRTRYITESSGYSTNELYSDAHRHNGALSQYWDTRFNDLYRKLTLDTRTHLLMNLSVYVFMGHRNSKPVIAYSHSGTFAPYPAGCLLPIVQWRNNRRPVKTGGRKGSF